MRDLFHLFDFDASRSAILYRSILFYRFLFSILKLQAKSPIPEQYEYEACEPLQRFEYIWSYERSETARHSKNEIFPRDIFPEINQVAFSPHDRRFIGNMIYLRRTPDLHTTDKVYYILLEPGNEKELWIKSRTSFSPSNLVQCTEIERKMRLKWAGKMPRHCFRQLILCLIINSVCFDPEYWKNTRQNSWRRYPACAKGRPTNERVHYCKYLIDINISGTVRRR